MDYLIKESQFLRLMTRLLVVGILTALMVSAVPISHAAEIKELETGILFGGLHGMANETIAANSTLDDLPAIAEDYTATWCGNCVEVGNALETVAENVSMEIYAVHRNIYETQDPLGNENVDQRFRDRYGFYAPQFKPPVAGINGKYALQGSNPVGDSLESDFAELATQPRNLGDGFVRWHGHQQVRILEQLLGASTNLPLQSTTLAYGWLRRSPTSRMGRTIRCTTITLFVKSSM